MRTVGWVAVLVVVGCGGKRGLGDFCTAAADCPSGLQCVLLGSRDFANGVLTCPAEPKKVCSTTCTRDLDCAALGAGLSCLNECFAGSCHKLPGTGGGAGGGAAGGAGGGAAGGAGGGAAGGAGGGAAGGMGGGAAGGAGGGAAGGTGGGAAGGAGGGAAGGAGGGAAGGAGGGTAGGSGGVDPCVPDGGFVGAAGAAFLPDGGSPYAGVLVNWAAADAGAVASATTTYSGWPASRAIDQKLTTSWFAAASTCTFSSPWYCCQGLLSFDVTFPADHNVQAIELRGDREYSTYRIFRGRIEVLSAADAVLATANVAFPPPNEDFLYPLPAPVTARKVRLVVLTAEASGPAFSELSAWGN